ncbi:MAG: hypothetical protein KatS3mg054_0587 [Chloroflexus sp.]|nr:MAG: hypothetical protein KatS3mg054_0587 [Chloroflexus sp.]
MKKVFYPTKGGRIAPQPGMPGQTTQPAPQPAPQPGMPNQPVPRRGGKGQIRGLRGALANRRPQTSLSQQRKQGMGTGEQPFNQNQPPLV